MNKAGILIICLGMSFSSGFSQINWGIKGGPNLSATFTYVAGLTIPYRCGMNIGGFVQMKFSNRFFVLPELMYSLKGNKADDGSLDLNYINMPVLAGFKLVGRLSIVAGPELGYLLNANERSNNVKIQVSYEFRRFELGLAGGLRYAIGAKWGAEFRYIYGIYGILKSVIVFGPGAYSVTPEKDNTTNRVIQMGFYYNIF
jgi:hypothetical protein